MNDLNSYAQKLMDMGIEYAPKLIGALLVLTIGFWITNRLVNVMQRRMQKAKVDPSLQPFLLSMVGVLLKVMIVFSAAGIIGIQTASFVAVLGAAGLAVGLALQGSLSNFASGVLILLFRPYRVGDFITAQGHTGTVKEIQIFTTIVATIDNRMVILPNSAMLSGAIENETAYPDRMLDLTFEIDHETDIDKAKQVAAETIPGTPGYLPDKGTEVFIRSLSESAIQLGVRFWVDSTGYWVSYFHYHEFLKKAFNREGVVMTSQLLDVRLHQD